MMDVQVRVPYPGDSPYLKYLDRKYSEFAYSTADWQLLNIHFTEWIVEVAVEYGELIGFSVVEPTEDSLIIHKLVGEDRTCAILLYMIEARASDYELERVEYHAPEYSCKGGSDPWDVSRFLNKSGFLCEEVQQAMFNAYGNDVDGFIFRKKVPARSEL